MHIHLHGKPGGFCLETSAVPASKYRTALGRDADNLEHRLLSANMPTGNFSGMVPLASQAEMIKTTSCEFSRAHCQMR